MSRRASRGGIAGLGEATTNLSPPVEDHFTHPSFPKKHTLQAERAGQGREGKGCSRWALFLVHVTSLEKNLSLLFHAAWGIT